MTREEAIQALKKEKRTALHENKSAFDIAIKALEQEPKFIVKSDGTIEQIKNCNNCKYGYLSSICQKPNTEICGNSFSQWIPIKTRPLTNKEKKKYADLGYSEINFMYDCSLPEDGEEVLITTRYDEVSTDTFYRDDGCYFETYCDEDDVKAWMPLPEPYKAESEEA